MKKLLFLLFAFIASITAFGLTLVDRGCYFRIYNYTNSDITLYKGYGDWCDQFSFNDPITESKSYNSFLLHKGGQVNVDFQGDQAHSWSQKISTNPSGVGDFEIMIAFKDRTPEDGAAIIGKDNYKFWIAATNLYNAKSGDLYFGNGVNGNNSCYGDIYIYPKNANSLAEVKIYNDTKQTFKCSTPSPYFSSPDILEPNSSYTVYINDFAKDIQPWAGYNSTTSLDTFAICFDQKKHVTEDSSLSSISLGVDWHACTKEIRANSYPKYYSLPVGQIGVDNLGNKKYAYTQDIKDQYNLNDTSWISLSNNKGSVVIADTPSDRFMTVLEWNVDKNGTINDGKNEIGIQGFRQAITNMQVPVADVYLLSETYNPVTSKYDPYIGAISDFTKAINEIRPGVAYYLVREEDDDNEKFTYVISRYDGKQYSIRFQTQDPGEVKLRGFSSMNINPLGIPVNIVSTHLAARNIYDNQGIRDAQLKEIASWNNEGICIIAGDLNDFSSTDAAIGRDGHGYFVNRNINFIDAYSIAGWPTYKPFTCRPVDISPLNGYWTIDHIMIYGVLNTQGFQQWPFDVDRTPYSDHCPIWTSFFK